MRTNVAKVLKLASRTEVDDARGQLASFLRDTLVGLNYAYYEPPCIESRSFIIHFLSDNMIFPARP